MRLSGCRSGVPSVLEIPSKALLIATKHYDDGQEAQLTRVGG